MTRAEERAREEICTRCPERLKHCGLMDYPNQCINAGHFVFGYRQAEKDTIQRIREEIDRREKTIKILYTGINRDQFVYGSLSQLKGFIIFLDELEKE